MQELQQLLDQVRESVHATFPESARREQFDAHLATVQMTLEHLYAEQANAQEAAEPADAQG